LLGRYLQKNLLDKRVYVSLGGCPPITKFSTYNYRERDIDRPTHRLGWWWGRQKRCDDYIYNVILSNISQIIVENLNSKKDILFVFDNAVCHEKIVSHLETVLNKERSSFNIYSKSYKRTFLHQTVEIKKEELRSINIASVVPQYTGKRYEALKNVQREELVEGLTGRYYADAEFGKLVDTRIDKGVNFNWLGGSPLPSMKPDDFSIEWNGYISADASRMYWFFTTSDGGARLWIDDDLIIDNWNPNVTYEQCEPVFLGSGLHKIKLRYFESEGFASITLSWASHCKSVISPWNLFSIKED
jgi:hypothetical protein